MTDTTNWIIHPIFQSQRGNKSAQITFKDKTPIKFFVNDTSTPFNPSSWTPGDKRITLDLQVTQESEEFCKALDKFVLDTVSANTGNYFKKNYTPEELKDMYKSAIHEHDRTAATIRSKFDTGSIRCWDLKGNAVSEPTEWRKTKMNAHVTVKGLWFNPGSFGVTLEVFDVMVDPQDCSCPFKVA